MRSTSRCGTRSAPRCAGSTRRPKRASGIICGAGKQFTAGIDLALLGAIRAEIADACDGRAREKLRRLILDLQDTLTSIERCRKPVIAAIHGACIGGGVDLVTACDIRLCTADAVFSVREIDVGMTADLGTLQRLPRLIGEGMARELAYTGRNVDGREAREIRLVNRCYDTREALLAGARELAATIAAKSPLSVRGAKEMITYARDHSVARRAQPRRHVERRDAPVGRSSRSAPRHAREAAAAVSRLSAPWQPRRATRVRTPAGASRLAAQYCRRMPAIRSRRYNLREQPSGEVRSMANYATSNIRTVALVGQGGSGKTTLAEALLLASGAIKEAGTVERGTTVSDFDPLEKSWQHSLRASILHLDTQDTRVHLVDTPGFPDFIGQAIGALDAVETAAVVVSAQSGIEMIASRMMDWAAKRRLCRLVIVNKIDAENVDLPNLLASIQSLFGKECLPINLPAGGGKRVVDCFFNPDGESDFSSVGQAHSALVDQVVEVDEALMALYLEQGEIAPEELHAPFEKALREGHLVPVCFVSAKTGAGVAELLDVLVKLAPNPAEGNPPLFYKGEGESASEFRSEPDPKKHVLAHVFKVVMDPFVGKLGIFRVHQGTVTKDTQLFVGDGRKPFKVGHLFMLQGGKNVEIERAVPGDIAAVAKVDEIEFDCVLHDSHDEDHIHMRPLEFPTPMQGVAITPKKRGDEQRISEVLHRMIAEDPTLVVEHDATTNETVLRALGDLHLRSVLERMASQFKLEVDTRPPRIPYRETITGAGGGVPPPQEADGRRRAVRRGLAARRAARARRRLRVPRPDQGRRDPAPVHAGGAEGRRAGARHRRDRRLSAAGRARRRATTASTTRWTRRKSRSSPPARRRSSTRSRRRGPSCSSRSSPSR